MNPAAPITIRAYRDADAAAVRACIVELHEFERRIDPRLRPGDSMADDYIAQIHVRCRSWAGTILVAERDDAVGGMVAIYARVPFEELDDPPGDYALVSDLIVREAFRGRGVGAALLHEAERYAMGKGATEIRIGVLSGNQAARDIYRRAGYAPYLETLTKRPSGDSAVPGAPRAT